MANRILLIMKPAMPVSLMELLAIPLSCQRTTTKWLVISPGSLPQAGERDVVSLREFPLR